MAADRPGGLADAEVEARLARLDHLLDRLEHEDGPVADTAVEAVGTLTEVYGTALARIVALLAEGAATLDALAADDLVGHLMLLHGLHPASAADRIARALDDVRAQIGGDVELVGIDESGMADIRMSASGCQSSSGATASAIGDLVLAAAPELRGVNPQQVRPPAEPALIPVTAVLRRPEVRR